MPASRGQRPSGALQAAKRDRSGIGHEMRVEAACCKSPWSRRQVGTQLGPVPGEPGLPSWLASNLRAASSSFRSNSQSARVKTA
jgi:hypothetical protein